MITDLQFFKWSFYFVVVFALVVLFWLDHYRRNYEALLREVEDD